MNGLATKTDLPSVPSVNPHIGIDREKPERRFWAKVNKDGPNGCWEWRGAKHSLGYGGFRLGKRLYGKRRMVLAHRFAYEQLVGPILTETLDHLCRNPACVNPAHLEPVSQRTNLLRGNGFAAKKARQTHCIHGHPFDLFNIYITPDGRRDCRICRQIASRKYKARKD